MRNNCFIKIFPVLLHSSKIQYVRMNQKCICKLYIGIINIYQKQRNSAGKYAYIFIASMLHADTSTGMNN